MGHLVDKMERYMADRVKVKGRLYAIFKEGSMKELLNNLERAKSSLILALTMYYAAEQRRRGKEANYLLSAIQAQLLARNGNIQQQQTMLLQSPPQSRILLSPVAITPASRL